MISYTDYYLRAESEADMIAALSWARVVDEAGDPVWLTGGADFALEPIGAMEVNPAVFDANENLVTPAVMDMGFHLNLRTWDGFAETIDPALIMTPATPKRVFF